MNSLNEHGSGRTHRVRDASRSSMARNALRLSILFVLATSGWMINEQPTLFLIGDSTMADKPLVGNPERGWGQMLPSFFNAGIRFENHARNGRSTKSFIREGRWDSVYQRLKPGDYLFVQFGHNDQKKEDSSRYAAPRAGYTQNLLRFVKDARRKGAIPVLITPVCRRRFDERGQFIDVHGDYPAAVRDLGKEEEVPVIDLDSTSFALFSRMGPEETKKLFLWADSGVYSAVPEGKKDNTHFTPLGAEKVADLATGEIRRLGLPLAKMLKPQGEPRFEGAGKIVLLDNYYNNEWKKDPAGIPTRFHYLWQDTANSGFSILAAILSRTGAVVDSLCRRPTAASLRNASLYIIVDPDTPQETSAPNYMTDEAADAVAAWVKEGGVLALFGNDKGNMEFEHFNLLAERFGIHFNEDSRNKVQNDRFDDGAFGRFPDHPIFRNVRRVFLKELSTLRISAPASAIFTEGGDVIMAFARYGKGAVFVVGDPWLYNEYMDGRKLPEGYDNMVAADNLFRWLLQN